MRIRRTSPWNGIGFFEWQELFFFCADDIRMIRAPRNNQHSGRSFNGRWAFCMNQCFILLQHQSSFFFFSSVFSFTPSYLSIVMNLLLTTWPLPFIPSNFLYYLSLSYYLLGLTFFLIAHGLLSWGIWEQRLLRIQYK